MAWIGQYELLPHARYLQQMDAFRLIPERAVGPVWSNRASPTGLHWHVFPIGSITKVTLLFAVETTVEMICLSLDKWSGEIPSVDMSKYTPNPTIIDTICCNELQAPKTGLYVDICRLDTCTYTFSCARCLYANMANLLYLQRRLIAV